MSKFYYSTQSDCSSILTDMDTYFNYPNSSTNTTTTSEVIQVSGSEYIVCIPDSYYNRLTQDQKDKCKDSMPESITNPL